MTEVLATLGAALLGWGASVEFRLGQLIKMKNDVEKTADRVDKIYELMVKDERTAEEGPGEGRGSS